MSDTLFKKEAHQWDWYYFCRYDFINYHQVMDKIKM